MQMLSYEFFLLFSGLVLAGVSVYLVSHAFLMTVAVEEDQVLWSDEEERHHLKSPAVKFFLSLARQLTLNYSSRFLKNKEKKEALHKKILTAGLSKALNVNEFVALQILLGIAFPIFFFLVNFALQLNWPWMIFPVMAFLGYKFPHFYCQMEKTKRDISVLTDFPFFIDLLALSTEAGLDFINALQKITEKMKNNSILSEEVSFVLKEIKVGSSREEALQGLAKRLDLPEISSFVNLIIDSSQTGVSVSDVLKQQSSQIRSERFIKAEKAGAKASIHILIPMALFIIPAIFIAVMAPAALTMFYGGQ